MIPSPPDDIYDKATRRHGVEQAKALREQARAGGLRFEAYLPPDLAEWLLDQVESGMFVDAQRRLATLVVFARETEAILTDAGVAMFDKMLGTVCRRADQAHKEHVIDRAKMLDASTRALLGMAKAMLAARACGEDQIAAVERALGWERLTTLVAEADKVVMREDNLGEIVDRYPAVHRMVPILLGAFVFRSWKFGDPLLAALDVLRDLCATGARSLPVRAPTAFLRPAWRKLVGTGAALDRRTYEVAVMMELVAARFGPSMIFSCRPGRSRRGNGKTNWAWPLPAASRSGAPSMSAASKPGSRKSMRSRPPASSPTRSSPLKGCRSARSARTKPTHSKMSHDGSMACCLACASPSFSPKCMAGRDSPSGSVICEPGRQPKIAWR